MYGFWGIWGMNDASAAPRHHSSTMNAALGNSGMDDALGSTMDEAL